MIRRSMEAELLQLALNMYCLKLLLKILAKSEDKTLVLDQCHVPVRSVAIPFSSSNDGIVREGVFVFQII
ncbi:MAG: hypothetical protein E6J34_24200 [Chloroflexi bacterium]|nr:MAG: hypothetical protein E6J34_24200 [Chloroflexota bacterium]